MEVSENITRESIRARKFFFFLSSIAPNQKGFSRYHRCHSYRTFTMKCRSNDLPELWWKVNDFRWSSPLTRHSEDGDLPSHSLLSFWRLKIIARPGNGPSYSYWPSRFTHEYCDGSFFNYLFLWWGHRRFFGRLFFRLFSRLYIMNSARASCHDGGLV